MTRIIIIIIARCRSNPWLALNFFIIFFFFFFFLIISRSVFFLTGISIYRFVRLIRAYASMPRINVLTFFDFRSIALHFGRSYLSSLSFSCSPTLTLFFHSLFPRPSARVVKSFLLLLHLYHHPFFFLFDLFNNSTCLHIHRI